MGLFTWLRLSVITSRSSALPLIGNPGGTAADQQREMRQLEVFESTVTNPSPDIDPTIRRHAAEELMAMDVPAATDVLAGALQSGAPAVELAVIEAMEVAARPVKGLMEPAVS